MIEMIGCKECPERQAEPNCHMTCEKYKQFVAENKKIAEAKKEEWISWDAYIKRPENLSSTMRNKER